jgi:ATP-dependent RNA helicase DeaD
MELFRVEVGHTNGVQPGNLVGAIANEAGLASANIGRIEIYDAYSTIELPAGMPKEIFRLLKKVWVSGRQLDISKVGSAPPLKPMKKRGAAPRKSNADGKPRKPAKQHS